MNSICRGGLCFLPAAAPAFGTVALPGPVAAVGSLPVAAELDAKPDAAAVDSVASDGRLLAATSPGRCHRPPPPLPPLSVDAAVPEDAGESSRVTLDPAVCSAPCRASSAWAADAAEPTSAAESSSAESAALPCCDSSATGCRSPGWPPRRGSAKATAWPCKAPLLPPPGPPVVAEWLAGQSSDVAVAPPLNAAAAWLLPSSVSNHA